MICSQCGELVYGRQCAKGTGMCKNCYLERANTVIHTLGNVLNDLGNTINTVLKPTVDNILTTDEEFKKVVSAAYEGYGKIPAEVKDIDAGEGLELIALQTEYIPKFINAFKKEA